MSPVEETPASDEALRLALQSQLSPTILTRLDEVRERSRLIAEAFLDDVADSNSLA
jgi:hypothetical protein